MSAINIQSVEKLTNNNYESWKVQMRSILRYNELWGYVNGDNVKSEANAAVWTTKDEKALDLVILSLDKGQYNHVKRAETSKQAWEALKSVHESKGPMKQCVLFKQLYKMKKSTSQSMAQYIDEYTHKLEQLEDAGIKLPEEVLPIMLLTSLPSEYETFSIAIESREKLPTMEELKVKLLEEEIRKTDNEVTTEDTNHQSALVIKKNINKYKNLKQKPSFNNTDNQKFKGTCHICKKYGHMARKCRFRTQEGTETNQDAMTATALQNTHMKSNSWVLDSGATKHITHARDKLGQVKTDVSKIYTATNESVDSLGSGDADLSIKINERIMNNVTLKDTMLAPDFKNNLMSVSQITKHGFSVLFERYSAKVLRQDGTVAIVAKEQNGLYVVEEKIQHKAMIQTNNDSSIKKWHERLGHLNFNEVRNLKLNQMVFGINDNLQGANPDCEICNKCKIHQLPFNASKHKSKQVLELIHSDICGPFNVSSIGGASYFITFIDDKSRYVFVKMLKNKSDALEAFKEYKAYAENFTGKKIKKIRTDNAREYLSEKFNDFLKTSGITRQLSVAYTPQQNGVAERANRTLVEMARCMLLEGELPLSLWAETVNAAAFIRNRCPTRANPQVTPHEEWSGEKPYIGFLRKIGSKVIALKKGPRRNKFEPKGKECILVGYSNEAKAYRLWERGTRTVTVTRDVRFSEEQNKTVNPETIQFQEINTRESCEEDMPDNVETEEEESTEYQETPISSRGPGRPKMLRTGNRGRPRKIYNTQQSAEQQEIEPTTVEEAMNGLDSSA